MRDEQELTLLIKSRFPLVLIETHEEARALALLEKICNLQSLPLFVWSVTAGLRRQGRNESVPQTGDPAQALRHIEKTLQNGVYALLDFHPFLEDALHQRLTREIAMGYHKTARTLVFVSPQLELNNTLTRMSARFRLSVLDVAAVKQMIRDEADLWKAERGGERLRGQKEAVDLLAQHLAGMSADDARRLVRQAIRDDTCLNLEDVSRVLKHKHQSLAADSLLALELDTTGFAEVGGLGNLKRWLERRRAVFTGAAQAQGLDAPKGILLLGVQGGGKSLAAKAVAGAWGVPLLSLDFGALYNKFFGQTERNLREALAAAEAMAPCVLWMDELEKGVGGDATGDSDGGVSRRVLGTLLTWMAERKSRVFLVATANDIARLPPELIRKGRFDEIFFVDLPDAATRKEIFAIHLRRRKALPESFDLDALARAADGFSGAEIEQVIVSGLYEAHASGGSLDTEILKREIAGTRPLSTTMAEHIQALRDWAQERTVPAN
ncbi:MAG TPA: AAA family ATPase [Burkholderiales bacterium]|nr:AAA family ATPase [Burkholderiales bacterium]